MVFDVRPTHWRAKIKRIFLRNNIARLTFINSNKVRTKYTEDVCLMRYTLYNVSRNAAMINYDTMRAAMKLLTENN